MPRLRTRLSSLRPALCLAALASLSWSARADPVQIPVLVIATYETGSDRGDVPGELQYWAERENLDDSVAVPGLDHPLLSNGTGLYAMVCGTTSRCAVQIMALAADPRFDLRRTYLLVDGIAGGDPATVSLASAAWIRHVVDGNPAFEIDSREIPAAWPYGLVSFGALEPGKGPANIDSVPAAGASDNGTGGVGTVSFKLNPTLADWAYGLTKGIPIPDDGRMAASRARFRDYPAAQRPPFVLEGDSLAADRFWHGQRMAAWARDWVRLFTRGAGALAMSDCEDAGVCIAVQRLDRMGKVDFNRLMVLRVACNYVMPPPGVTPAAGLFTDTVSESGGIAYLPALDTCHRVGSVVTAELLRHWDQYRDRTP
jgi:purine nucleoside permease